MISILGFAAGLLIALFIGYFAVSIIAREMELRFRILFSIPLGFAITSVLYFIYVCLNFNNFKMYWIFEAVLALILAMVYFNEEKPDMSKHKFHKLSSWFYLVNLYAVLIYLKYFINNPMGSWDGFRIWNIKAEFLFQESPLWHNVFQLPHFMTHNDYPMFLPSMTARLWHFIGAENFAVNITLGLFFTFGLVYLLFQAVSYFKSEKAAIVVTSVFMISDIFLVNGASQCADVPLAFFFLSAIVCLFLYFRKERLPYLILGTLFAGMSTWVKNEGMMFFAIWLVVVLFWLLRTKKYKFVGYTALTAIPILVLIAMFKKLTHSPNDLIMGFFLLKTYGFALDFHRYAVIVKTFFVVLFQKFPLFLVLGLLCVKGFKIKDENKTPFLLSLSIFVLMCVGYFVIYLLSPHDINWLVENSMDRLIIQVLPIFLFLFAVNLRIGKPDSVK